MSPRSRKLEELLPRFSLNRRVTVLVLLATALVVGAVATLSIQLELFPSGFTEPFLSVEVPWREAPTQEVLEKIVQPMEEELSSVRGLSKVVSIARTSGGRVHLIFKHGTDMDVAYREVRDRAQRARLLLPDDADRYFIFKNDTSGIPIFMIGLGVDPDLPGSYELIQNKIVRPLERIDGVASITVQGLIDKEILIEVDRSKIEAAGLNIYELAQQLGGDNFSLSSGNVVSGGKKLLLRSMARYTDVEALENRPVARNVKLKDIATVTYAEPEREFRVRVNSRPAVALIGFKEGQANTIEVSERMVALVGQMQDDPRLANIDIEPFFNQGDAILSSIGTLLDSGKLGALFAVVVLFFFLRRFRMTLIITLSIPLSIVIALTVMYFAGETLNVLSLLGLMISVGLLVDNSVVVAENIFRMHRNGVPRREACIRGAAEIALAITTATLTTVAVFLPVSLVEGQGQFFLLRLSIPISVSLLASLFVALVFVPLAVYLTLPENGSNRQPAWMRKSHRKVNDLLRGIYDRTFEPLNRAYGRLLAFAIRRRADGVLVLLLVFFGSMMLFTDAAGAGKVEFVQQQEEERAQFEIDVDFPDATTLEEAEEWFAKAEVVLAEHQEPLGYEGFFFFHRATFGEISVWFDPLRKGGLSAREVSETLMENFPEKAGIKYYTGDQSEREESTEKVHAFVITGEDAEALERVGKQLEEVFAQVPGVLGAKRGAEKTPNELALVVDRDRAQRQQINPSVIAGVVGYALRGQSLPRFYHEGEEIDVRVRFQESDRESLTDLNDFDVPNEANDTPISLAAVTDVQFLESAKRIVRRDKRISHTIALELEEDKEDEARAALMAMASRMDLPEGMSFSEGRQAQGTDDDLQGMLLALGLSIVFIYLLMCFLFESFILPLSILLTIPLATIGVAWAHFISGLDIDMLGMVGLVLLVGVVVNNGIVLIDYVNRLRTEGRSRSEALILATERRFRPIMMTALTTIFGMVPLALGGQTELGLSYTSFSFTLIGGLTTATVLTLLVVPIFYTLFDDLRLTLMSTVSRIFGGRRGSRGKTAPVPGS